MLLSLVGERFRSRHVGVGLALAFKARPNGLDEFPKVATTLRKLSRYKYGVPGKQSKLGNAPDYVETLCGIEFLCWVDSSREPNASPTLEERIVEAISTPENITRYGVLSLGLSDDAVNDISLVKEITGDWHALIPTESGSLELPVWVDHIGSAKTRWRRYELEQKARIPADPPGEAHWTMISAPT